MLYQIPAPNRLSNQLHTTGSTLDLLMYDNTMLDGMLVPEGIDRDDVIACIVEQYGQQTLAHPDPEYMRRYVPIWSKRRLGIWTKLLKTTELEYNPIENYDRTEEITEQRETGRQTSTKTTATGGDVTESSNNTEHLVSAENEYTYQPDSKDTAGENMSVRRTNDTSGNVGESGTENFIHRNHTHGNIGVTTSQQMIEAERSVVRYSIIEEIAADYRDAFCLSIY